MLHPSAEDWRRWGIQEECHQFFALHWTELFDPETPDTWQVRTSNVKTILRELVEAARIAKDIESYRRVIRALLDEAFAVVKRDAILEAYHPFVAAYSSNRGGTRTSSSRDPPDVERLATVLLGNLDGYWENGVSLILAMLERADRNRKKDQYAATMNLGIETVARGHSPGHIRQTLINSVLIESATPFLDRVRAMLAGFARGASRHICRFVTEGTAGEKDADSLPPDVRLGYGRPAEVTSEAAERFFRRVTRYSVYLSVEVNAADPEAARHIAEQRLGQVFAGMNLFNIDDHIGLKQAEALVEDDAGTQTLVEHQRLGSHYLGSYESRQTKAELLFRVQQAVAESDAAQLSAAVQYHRLALLATSEEARLVNLWVALEALCQGGAGSIIERVSTRVAPCVAVENARKTLISLALYVRFLWRESDDKDAFLRLFPNSSDERLQPEDLVSVLLLPKADAKITELCRL